MVAQTARQQFNFNQIIFVPSNTPPHKSKPINTFKSRYEELSTQLLPHSNWAKISTIEEELPPPHYTINSLRALVPNLEEHKQDIPYILGADSFLSLPSWHQPEQLSRHLWFLVAPRKGFEITPSQHKFIQELSIRYDNIEMPMIPVSSSEIRDASTNLKEAIR